MNKLAKSAITCTIIFFVALFAAIVFSIPARPQIHAYGNQLRDKIMAWAGPLEDWANNLEIDINGLETDDYDTRDFHIEIGPGGIIIDAKDKDASSVSSDEEVNSDASASSEFSTSSDFADGE